MKRFILNIILRLGRYAVLPAVALACVILAVWLVAMDRYTITALVTAPVVFSIFLGALALTIGLLLLPSRKHRDFEADEAIAPGLWAMWRELDRSFARSRRTLLINTEFNASIGEVSRYAGLFGQHVTMTVGLPMLIVLDERAIRAVVAHEVAHAQLRHTSEASTSRISSRLRRMSSSTPIRNGPSPGALFGRCSIPCSNGSRRSIARYRGRTSWAPISVRPSRLASAKPRVRWC
ncbi:M48 family metallopeptidase [Bradyrhizobium huanghuaihaiense]|uniref:M48 family metallopeptidase n=1 Tax=Bradyrhizobium huanghuaihaiense TaxID=990078 RepID=UPI001FCE7FE9|nr:M48 family metallopeptidase [Bradyrhizobium huanghuaihaiense]